MTRLSVLIAVYNGGEALASSVQSILEQSFTDFELVIVDDGSIDSTPAYLASLNDPRVRVMTIAHAGVAQALQVGLHAASGEYVARQDHDDVSHPDRLARQVKYLNSNPEIALVGSWAVMHNGDGRYLEVLRPPTSPVSVRWRLLFYSAFVNSTTMFRRAAAIEAGGYLEDGSEDYDLWARLADRHPVTNLPLALAAYQLSPQGAHVTDASRMARRSMAISAGRIAAALGRPADDEQAHLVAAMLRPGTEPAAADLLPAARGLLMLQEEFLRAHPVTSAERAYISRFAFCLIAAVALRAATLSRAVLLGKLLALSRRTGAGVHRVALLAVLLVGATMVGGASNSAVRRLSDHLRRDDPRWLLLSSTGRAHLPATRTPKASVFGRLVTGLDGGRWRYAEC